MNQKGSSLIVGVIIGAVAAITLGGYYLLSSRSNGSPKASLQSISQSNIRFEPSPDNIKQTSKTYTSKEHGYSFVYPDNWFVEEQVVAGKTNVLVLDDLGEQKIGFNAEFRAIGCGPTEPGGTTPKHVLTEFVIGNRTIGMGNFCGSNKYFIKALTKDQTEIQLELDFVGTSAETKARELLRQLENFEIPNNS